MFLKDAYNQYLSSYSGPISKQEYCAYLFSLMFAHLDGYFSESYFCLWLYADGKECYTCLKELQVVTETIECALEQLTLIESHDLTYLNSNHSNIAVVVGLTMTFWFFLWDR